MSDSYVLADSNALIQRCFNSLPTGMAVEQLCCHYRGMNEALRERLFVALVGALAVAKAMPAVPDSQGVASCGAAEQDALSTLMDEVRALREQLRRQSMSGDVVVTRAPESPI